MEDLHVILENFIQKSHKRKMNLKAQIEEINIRIGEVQEAKELFDQNVVIEGVDPISQRIAAEKFVKYELNAALVLINFK